MKRDRRFDQEKELRKLWKEYVDVFSWKKRRESGTFVEVKPYQKGWIRYYTLRYDISRRDDARIFRRCLDLINYEKHCSREDFTRWSYKHKKYEPISQPLRRISEKKYEELEQKYKKYFHKIEVRYKWMTHSFFEYEFIYPYYYVFVVEPNIITHHWMPDPEFESRRSEIVNKLRRDNLWPKIYRSLGIPAKEKNWRLSPYLKTKRGMEYSGDDIYIKEESL